ncbi:polyketide synthase dehydratase domain-containing protein, partial [Streptomyces sp. NPDC002690]
MRHAREAVRFADAVQTLVACGAGRFVELGPGALVSAVAATAEQAGEGADGVSVVPLLSRQGSEQAALMAGLGRLFVSGVPVSWRDWQSGGNLVDLPTYAFRRDRYWLSTPSSVGDVKAAGLASAGHPVLGAVVAWPGSSGVLLTGQVSRSAQPWLADHEVLGHVMVPASALVELAVRAGDEVGCPVIGELAMTAPLVVPERGGVQVHVMVAEADEHGRREIEIHSRPDAASDRWQLHARGVLAPAAAGEEEWPESVWPPAGAQAVDVDAAYEALAGRGYGYGPAFRAVRAVWRRGPEIFAEVAAPKVLALAGFGIHPAVLDAAVHAQALGADAADTDDTGSGEVRVPFLWEGVTLHAAGASTVRVRISPAGADAATVQVVDETGAPVLTVASLATRPVTAEALADAASAAPDGLFEVAWSPLPVRSSSSAALPVEWWEWCSAPDADPAAEAHRAAHEALDRVQTWLVEGDPQARLAVVTRGAVALSGEEVADLAASAVWGLVRSAQSENPGRFVLIDTDAELS